MYEQTIKNNKNNKTRLNRFTSTQNDRTSTPQNDKHEQHNSRVGGCITTWSDFQSLPKGQTSYMTILLSYMRA